MNPPHLQDKKPECFVGNATYFVSEIIMIQEKQDLKTKITPFKWFLNSECPFVTQKKRGSRISIWIVSVRRACIDLPYGKIKKTKNGKRKTNPNTDDVCYAHLCLLLGCSESVYSSVQIHIQTSFENSVYSKIVVYQGCKVSKSLWIFLCVKSLWSQDRRGVKPRRFWMCVCGHSSSEIHPSKV